MNIRENRPQTLLAFLLLLTWSVCGLAAIRADTPPDPAPPVSWEELVFGAERALGRVIVRIRLRHLDASTVELKAPAEDHGPALSPEGADPYLLTARIEARLLTGRKYWSGQAWFAEDSGRGLQRIRLKPGQGGSHKFYRYATRGVYRERTEPANRKEAKEPPALWTQVRRSFYPFDADALGCATVADPYALLYLIAGAELTHERLDLIARASE